MNLNHDDPFVHGSGIEHIGPEFWRDRNGNLHLIGSPPQETTCEQYTGELKAAGFTPYSPPA
jgi:hypothetical protein